MAWNRERVDAIAWRIAVLALPWQTRWFWEGPSVGGYPWENGRISFYVSWIPLVITVVLVLIEKRPWRSLRAVRSPFIAGFALVLFASCFSIFPRATIEWWLQVFLLGMFVWSLRVWRVSAESLAKWFLLSLIPHALLGAQQIVTQQVIGSKWLGIAPQDPHQLGVSVIEIAGERWLRAYGGFPHPNIFGAWLAAAVLLAIWLAGRVRRKGEKIACVVVAALLTAVLVFTFSRSAWLGLGFGLVVILVGLLRERRRGGQIRQPIIAILIVLAAFGLGLASQSARVASRLQTQGRLEIKSIDERAGSLRDGWQLFLHHPLVGTGPGTAAYALSLEGRPAIPPHLVLLLAADEVGLVGLLGLALCASAAVRHAWRRRQEKELAYLLAPLAGLVLISFFDHFLWSWWSGQALLAVIIVLVFSFSADP